MTERDTITGLRGPAAPNRELNELVLRGVRLRFITDAGEFVSRVHGLALAACGDSAVSLREYILKLCLDDLYLATACVDGDENAWRELSTAHFDFMREFARRFVPGQLARDVADEVIADLWARKKLRQYGGRSTLRTWLATVVTHAALNSRQTMNRVVPLEGECARAVEEKSSAFESIEPGNEQIAALLREMFAEAVTGLPANDRLLLRLYYEDGMTLEELSAMLRASGAAISRRLKRTREDLRAGIEARARRRTGESADALRAGLDLGRIEVDLGKLLGGELSKPNTAPSTTEARLAREEF